MKLTFCQGLRTVVRELSPTSPIGGNLCNKLAPKLVAQLENVSLERSSQALTN